MMKKLANLIIVIAILSSFYPAPVYGQDYSPESLFVKVYGDGVVDVEYVVEPDITLAQVNVSLAGESYRDLLVLDQDDVLLDWVISSEGIRVDSLGSTSITISYLTDSLTNKTGSQWVVSLSSSIPVVYTLPVDTILLGMNPSPIGLTIINNQAVITMPSGESQITYQLGSSGTREHALTLLNRAKADVIDAQDRGVLVNEAEALLEKAIQTYQSEQYVLSEQYSQETSTSAKDTVQQADKAMNQINDTETLILEESGRVDEEALVEAQSLLDQAQTSYTNGSYTEAYEYALEAHELILNSPVNETRNWIPVMAMSLIIVIGVLYWLLRKRGYTIVHRPDEGQPDIDLDRVFDMNPDLRTDDKAVLRYLEETGGVFITEVRDRFDIPKSSAWRMVRRLEREGFIESSKIGRETYLRLKEQEEME